MQMPFCRTEQPQELGNAPDVVIGRLVSRVSQLEQQLYAHQLQDDDTDGTLEHSCAA